MTATRKARIFRPVKTATQSGRAKTQLWVLEFERSDRVAADPLMGWIGGGDTRRQLLLKFPSRAAAEAYAAKHGIVCTVGDSERFVAFDNIAQANYEHEFPEPQQRRRASGR